MYNLKSEEEIMAGWLDRSRDPAVTVCCIAYNHEIYIESALKGFLIQETNFKFEIIIGEDCSSDGTKSIIERYRSRYPNLIRVISDRTNVGMNKNFFRVFNGAKGEYVAICEGDDCWVDKTKLQKQKDFMDSNKDYALCYSAADIFDEEGVKLGAKFSYSYKDSSEKELLYARSTVLTMTAFVRAKYLQDLPFEMGNVINLDRFMFSYLGQFGKGKFISNIQPSVYNIHSGGVWSLLGENKKEAASINTYYWMGNYFGRVGLKSECLYFYLKAIKIVLKKITVKHVFYIPSLILSKVGK